MRSDILHGDCLAEMAKMEANSIDAICCDPPYGIGFMNKGWDKPTGEEWGYFAGSGKRPSLNEALAFQGRATEWAEAMLAVAKPGAHLLAFGGTRTFHRLTCAVEDAGWEIRDCLMWLYGSGFPKSHNGPWGGTALKPAWEPVIVARKPLIGTVAANVTAHGTGAVNIDGCRIETGARPLRGNDGVGTKDRVYGNGSGLGSGFAEGETTLGRWPANVALDEEAAAMLDEQTGELQERGNTGDSLGVFAGYHGGGKTPRNMGAVHNHGDSGGASRFFYCAKASRAEREAGLSGERRPAGTFAQDEWSRSHMGNTPDADRQGVRNHHPTVKPVALMRWLCRLVTPPGGLILDPFAGSGTTGVACVLEGRAFLGIEREAAYVEIARRRIAEAQAQGNLFGAVA